MSISKDFFDHILKEQIKSELYIDLSKCGGCKDCVGACEPEAIKKNDKGLYIDNNLCNLCEKCIEICNEKGKAILRR